MAIPAPAQVRRDPLTGFTALLLWLLLGLFVVYPLLILAITGSPAQASWATALRIVPYLLLSLPVGALIDRWNRRRVMIICHLGRATTLASLPVAMVMGRLTVEQIYLVAVIEGREPVVATPAPVQPATT